MEVLTYMGKYYYSNNYIAYDKYSLGTIANDSAVVSQKLGAINPYNISVTFKITMSEATINE